MRGQRLQRCEDCGFQVSRDLIRLRSHPDYPNRIRLCLRCAWDAPMLGHRCQFPGIAHRNSIVHNARSH